MKILILAAFALLPCLANAGMIYRCPQSYPGKDAPSSPLTGAFMDSGPMHGSGQMAPPRDEAAEEGYDLPYAFSDDEQAWLICSYGAKKRIKGRFHDGHEWNQRMEGGAAEWWVKLAPQAGACTVQVREIKPRSPGKSTWTATATCRRH